MLRDATDTPTQLAEAILTSRLNFLFAADPNWATSQLVPLLGWTDPSRAQRAWSSFTSWSRWNDQMLDAGLMPLYIETARHLHQFAVEDRRPLLGHLAGIALTSEQDPLQWLPGVVASLAEADRVLLADQVSVVLRELPKEAVEHQWARWIREYWTHRQASVPARLSERENTAMAGWIPYLSDSFEVAVDLVTAQPGRFREHDDVLHRLESHLAVHPNATARVIGHLLSHTQKPWWGGPQLRELLPRLRAQADGQHIAVILEQAIRLGVIESDEL